MTIPWLSSGKSMQGVRPDVGPAYSLGYTRVQELSFWKNHSGVQACTQHRGLLVAMQRQIVC